MDDWGYVAVAYLVVWGAIALYTWTLQRRIAQARATYRAPKPGHTPPPDNCVTR